MLFRSVPLASFVAILFFGPRMGKHGKNAAWVATAAIVTSLVLSLMAAGTWLSVHPVTAAAHGHGDAHAAAGHGDAATADGHAAAGHGAVRPDWPGIHAGPEVLSLGHNAGVKAAMKFMKARPQQAV